MLEDISVSSSTTVNDNRTWIVGELKVHGKLHGHNAMIAVPIRIEAPLIPGGHDQFMLEADQALEILKDVMAAVRESRQPAVETY